MLDTDFTGSHIATYDSIFLEPDWILRKFQGWRLLADLPEGKLLRRNFGPFCRYLILTNSFSDIRQFLPRGLSAWFSQIIVKDLGIKATNAPPIRTFCNSTYRLSTDEERLLNMYTFAINLRLGEDTLWKNFNQTTRKSCRIAFDKGVKHEFIQDSSSRLVDVFIDTLANMAIKRGLVPPERSLIKRIINQGAGNLHYVSLSGEPLTFALIYRAGKKIFYLLGVSTDSDRAAGGGHLLHWEIIRHYKLAGLHWYDMGGVQEINSNNGIYKFKRGFGGALIDLGPEYVLTGVGVQLAMKSRNSLKRILKGRL